MSDVTRLVDELTTLLYEVLKRWEVEGRVCEIVACGACRKKADRPSSVVHESDCPVHRLWQALEIGEVVVRANAEEICDLEDERDNALGKLAELTRTAEWVTARCESANASIAALEAERDAARAEVSEWIASGQEYATNVRGIMAALEAKLAASEQRAAALVEAVQGAAHRICGAYGPCFCRPPQPSAELGHERACQVLRRALMETRAALAASAGEG